MFDSYCGPTFLFTPPVRRFRLHFSFQLCIDSLRALQSFKDLLLSWRCQFLSLDACAIIEQQFLISSCLRGAFRTHGSRMVLAWSSHGPRMVLAWFSHGPRVFSSGLVDVSLFPTRVLWFYATRRLEFKVFVS